MRAPINISIAVQKRDEKEMVEEKEAQNMK